LICAGVSRLKPASTTAPCRSASRSCGARKRSHPNPTSSSFSATVTAGGPCRKRCLRTSSEDSNRRLRRSGRGRESKGLRSKTDSQTTDASPSPARRNLNLRRVHSHSDLVVDVRVDRFRHLQRGHQRVGDRILDRALRRLLRQLMQISRLSPSTNAAARSPSRTFMLHNASHHRTPVRFLSAYSERLRRGLEPREAVGCAQTRSRAA
jgi:hypothetical protein